MFWFEVDRESQVPFIRQIYERLRGKILRGDLPGGEKIPSSRELASHLQVSRNVVLEAYAQLIAEGYLDSREGSGTFVAAGAFLEPSEFPSQVNVASPSDAAEVGESDLIDFRTGVPALEMIPRQLLGKRFRDVCLELPATGYDYGSPEGSPALRKALARYLARTRGVHCDPACILVTTGAAEALYITAMLLLTNNASVAVEDPMHTHFQDTLRDCGAELWPIGVDENGLKTEELVRLKGNPAFIFVTPSHQFPLGGILPVQRRIELLRFAVSRGSFIVEDDYESEYHYGGTAVSSLQGMNPEGVIYIGTFSKILSPALRVGYLVLPARLAGRAREIKYVVDNHSSIFDQLVIAKLLESGELERHIAEMKKVYHRRQQVLVNALSEAFGDRCALSGTSTGLHIVAAFNGIDFTKKIMDELEPAGVRLHPIERHAIRKGHHAHQAIMGFGNLPESRILEGVRRLRRALDSLRA